MSIHEIKSEDDLQSFFADMRAAEAAANEAVLAPQRDIGWGDHFLRLSPTSDAPDANVLVIFAVVVTREACLQTEGPEGLAHMEETMERGYRFGSHYSVWEPMGELGSTHVSQVWPISAEQFADAREARWDPSALAWLPEVLAEARVAQEEMQG